MLRSGYYRWLNAASDRAEKEEKEKLDFEDILDAYNFRGYPKGARSIHMTLLNRKVPKEPRRMNIKKIRRLMKKYNNVFDLCLMKRLLIEQSSSVQ